MRDVSRKLPSVLTCIAFVAFLWSPLVALSVFGVAPDTSGENRAPTPFPRLGFSATAVKDFTRNFESYLQDVMPMRSAFVGLNQSMKANAAGVSPHPKVILGKEGHLYWTEHPIGKDLNALRPLTKMELGQWRDLLQARHDELARHGIKYLFVPAPDKQTIYPDFLPTELQTRLPKRSRLDQLFEELRTNSTVEFIDLRPVLREARAREETYYRTDTHWNGAGSHLAYREIMHAIKKWRPDLEPLSRDEVNLVSKGGLGDLAKLIGRIDDEKVPEEYRPKTERAHFETLPDNPLIANVDHRESNVLSSQANVPTPGRIIVLHDSFGLSLQRLLAHHFQRVDFVPSHRLNRSVVVAERPTIVIQEMVERCVYNAPLTDPAP